MAMRCRWKPEQGQDMSESEREIYEKARDATKEAQRQGDEQLQAVVAAAAAATPLRMTQTALSDCMFNWSLKFKDSKMENAYERKWAASSKLLDLISTACELTVSMLHLLMAFHAFHETNSMSGVFLFGYFRHSFTYLYLHSSALAFNMSVLILQFGGSKWYVFFLRIPTNNEPCYFRHYTRNNLTSVCRYNNNKGGILWYYSIFLWTWESIRLIFMTNEDLWLNSLESIIQCILIGLIHHAPFCIHIKSRIFGFGCQCLSLICKGKSESTLILLLSFCIGHLIGLTLNYWLDYRVRLSFIKPFPKWMLDDASSGNLRSLSSQQAKFTRTLWKTFCPEVLDTSEPTDPIPDSSSAGIVPHRALGGFAGGFGGVSGLKSRNTSVAVPLSSSDSLSGDELSDSSDDFWAGSSLQRKKLLLG